MQAYAKLRSFTVSGTELFIYLSVYLFFIMEFKEKSGQITVEVEKRTFPPIFYYTTPSATFEFLIPAQIEPSTCSNEKTNTLKATEHIGFYSLTLLRKLHILVC